MNFPGYTKLKPKKDVFGWWEVGYYGRVAGNYRGSVVASGKSIRDAQQQVDFFMKRSMGKVPVKVKRG